MSKKAIILITVSVMLISFFSGLFCEVTVQHELVSTSFTYKSYSDYIITCLEKNMGIMIVFFIASVIRIIKPAVFIVTGYKFFSSGFSAAFILYNIPKPLPVIISCIFLECCYTIPVFITMAETVFSSMSENRKNTASACLFCLSILTLFSFIQGFLIQLSA